MLTLEGKVLPCKSTETASIRGLYYYKASTVIDSMTPFRGLETCLSLQITTTPQSFQTTMFDSFCNLLIAENPGSSKIICYYVVESNLTCKH